MAERRGHLISRIALDGSESDEELALIKKQGVSAIERALFMLGEDGVVYKASAIHTTTEYDPWFVRDVWVTELWYWAEED